MSDQQFMTVRDIVNDVLHRLHVKDRELIRQCSLHQFQTQYYEFSQHIRNFYLLHHPDNPLVKESKSHPDEILDRVIHGVWDALQPFFR